MDQNDDYAPTLPPAPAVTILVPFDIGESYALFAENTLSKKEILSSWDKLFPQEPQKPWGWNSAQFSLPFRKPLNHIMRYLFSQVDPMKQAALGKISWISKERSTIEIVFFQLGIGVLIIRAPLADSLYVCLDQIAENTTRDAFREAVAPLIEHGAEAYKKSLMLNPKKISLSGLSTAFLT